MKSLQLFVSRLVESLPSNMSIDNSESGIIAPSTFNNPSWKKFDPGISTGRNPSIASKNQLIAI
jgi:hypothetical protein